METKEKHGYEKPIIEVVEVEMEGSVLKWSWCDLEHLGNSGHHQGHDGCHQGH